MGDYRRGMPNDEYWEQRMDDLDKALMKQEKQINKELANLYRDAIVDIKQKVKSTIQSYATGGNLTYQEAIKELDTIGIQEYQRELNKLITLYNDTKNPQVQKLIFDLQKRGRVNRLDALIDAINIRLSEVSVEVEDKLQAHMISVFEQGYNEVFDILNQAPIVIPQKEIIALLQYPYAGAMFSDRIWNNKDDLIKWIKQEFTQAIIRGDSYAKISKALQNKMEVTYYQAKRLVLTEGNFASNQGQMEGYKQNGITKYRYTAHIDERTCKDCKRLNGSIFYIKSAKVGVNFPPLHPHTRSRTIAVINKK